MGYQLTLFLVLIVYLQIISDQVPIPSDISSVPKLVISFIFIILLLGFAISVTAITMVLHFETGWVDTDEKKLAEWEVNLSYALANIFDTICSRVHSKIDIPAYSEEMKKYYTDLKEYKINQNLKNSTIAKLALQLTQSRRQMPVGNSTEEQTTVGAEEPPILPEYDEVGRKFLADMVNRVAFIIVVCANAVLVIFMGASLFIGRTKTEQKLEALLYEL